MNARRVLPLLIGASLSGCAAAPLYTASPRLGRGATHKPMRAKP